MLRSSSSEVACSSRWPVGAAGGNEVSDVTWSGQQPGNGSARQRRRWQRRRRRRRRQQHPGFLAPANGFKTGCVCAPHELCTKPPPHLRRVPGMCAQRLLCRRWLPTCPRPLLPHAPQVLVKRLIVLPATSTRASSASHVACLAWPLATQTVPLWQVPTAAIARTNDHIFGPSVPLGAAAAALV